MRGVNAAAVHGDGGGGDGVGERGGGEGGEAAGGEREVDGALLFGVGGGRGQARVGAVVVDVDAMGGFAEEEG